MLTLFTSLLFISYLFYVFIAEQLSPFSRSTSRLKRPHRKLGKDTAVASLVAGLVSIGLVQVGLQDRAALALYLLLMALLLIPSLLKFKRSRIWLSR